MGDAKQLRVKPIAAKDGNRIIKRLHYSGKVVPNSQVHLGVFLDGRCGGAMQFGPSLMKRNMVGLVAGTKWNGFIDLNRMAFADWLPRNGESRCIGYAMRWLRKTYPHLEWVVSFADGCQCGDGTIYRASGFLLTQIKKNSQMWVNTKTGEQRQTMQFFHTGTLAECKTALWQRMAGYQLRYLYFLNPTARERLAVPILPFSEINKRGAGMYRGKPHQQCVESIGSDAPGDQPGEGGAHPTSTLQLAAVAG